MKANLNESGNYELTFTSPIYIDNGYTNTFMGRFKNVFELFIHETDKRNKNGSAIIKWCVYNIDDDIIENETIGVWFEHGKLIDYDGIFELPKQAKKILNAYGISVSKDFFD
jgi:hypothetical protein